MSNVNNDFSWLNLTFQEFNILTNYFLTNFLKKIFVNQAPAYQRLVKWLLEHSSSGSLQ